MESIETIKARKLKLRPYIAICDKDKQVFEMPFLGSYVPKGFECIEIYFVDNSGFGSETEPALTANQFLNKVKKGFAYAIYEAGQFQIYIREYKVL